MLDDGAIHRLDQTGAAVVELLDGTRSVDDVVRALVARYEATSERVRTDVEAFLHNLAGAGLLVGGAADRLDIPRPPAAVRPVFDEPVRSPPGSPLVHRSGSLAALGWTFEVHSCDAQLGAYLSEILAPFATGDDPEHHYDIHREDGTGIWEVWVDDQFALRTPRTWLVVSWMLWHLTQQTIAVTGTHLLLHAGAVALGARAVVLCGPMNSGKSTLTGALVERGWTYLTDEAVAFDLDDGHLTPFPRPLVVGGASRALLAGLAPAPSWRARFRRRDWHLDLTQGTPPADGPIRAEAFVLPEVRLGQPGSLEPMAAIDAMEALCRNAWNLRGLGAPAFALLAREVRYAPCYSMHVNDLTEAESSLRAVIEGDEADNRPISSLRD